MTTLTSRIRHSDQTYTEVAEELAQELHGIFVKLFDDYSDRLHPDEILSVMIAEGFFVSTMKIAAIH